MAAIFYRAPFAGRERTFQLRLGEASELERLCNAGIGTIAIRLATLTYYIADVREAVRLGLQGGGTPEPDATALVMNNIDKQPLSEHIDLAANIVGAYLNGIPDDIKKKDQPDPSDSSQ